MLFRKKKRGDRAEPAPEQTLPAWIDGAPLVAPPPLVGISGLMPVHRVLWVIALAAAAVATRMVANKAYPIAKAFVNKVRGAKLPSAKLLSAKPSSAKLP